jgi:hypothetical protein
MVTVLDECTAEEQDIYKEMFSVYGGKCLSRKAVHNRREKFSQGRSKVADDETGRGNTRDNSQMTSVLRVLMRWKSNVSMLVKDMSRNECFPQVRISHVLRFISILTYLLTPSYNHLSCQSLFNTRLIQKLSFEHGQRASFGMAVSET